MIHLPDEPLWDSLVEIARCPEFSQSILAGGLGLRVKKAHLVASGARTLFKEPLDLRVTSDIDLFLEIKVWLDSQRPLPQKPALTKLGYEVKEEHWKFTKRVDGLPNRIVVLDLMAREPKEGEAAVTKGKRVKAEKDGEIHGYRTPEAFAIEDLPIDVVLKDTPTDSKIRVAHPYAYLNLKVAAANDWARELREEIKPKFKRDGEDIEMNSRSREKHVTDVYAIVGMMTEGELGQAEELAVKYADDWKAQEIRDAAQALYGTTESPGSAAIRAYSSGAWADHFKENYEEFKDTLKRAIGFG
jgi:hypothetical protein